MTVGRVDGNITIITRRGCGIGHASAEMLIEEGAHVTVTDIDAVASQETVKRIVEADGEAAFFDHDVTSEEDWEHVERGVVDPFGRPDILVNNAGIYHIESIEETTVENRNGRMEANVTGVFLGPKHCMPVTRKKDRGSRIYLSFVAGRVGLARRQVMPVTGHGRGPWGR